MPVTNAQKKASRKYDAKTYDQVSFRFPKGKKVSIQAHAAARGESLNGFVNRAINQTMERDSGASPSVNTQSVEVPSVAVPTPGFHLTPEEEAHIVKRRATLAHLEQAVTDRVAAEERKKIEAKNNTDDTGQDVLDIP